VFIKLLFILLLSILGIRFVIFYSNQPNYRDGQIISFEIDLLSEPRFDSRTQKFTAFLGNGQRIFITAPLFPQFNYGDRLKITGKLVIRDKDDGDKLYLMNFPEIEAEKENPSLWLVSSVRQKVISTFESTLPNAASGLLLGIVFGIKERIPQAFYEDLKLSGTLHVTAASGMNVTMVGGFLSFLFTMFLRRQIALIAAMIGILFYAVLAGLEPSIVRASIMGALVLSSQILGRQNWAAYALLLAGYLMLLVSPNLLFDVGFQLSFLATAGLIFILPNFPFRDKIWGSDFATTISAQIAVLPVLFSNFGTYSLFSIIANTLILWTIPILMVLGGLGAVAGFIFDPLASIFLYLSLPLLLYFEKVVSFSAGFGQMDVQISWLFILGYYLLLTAYLLKKR
jgi:competence protein ComEC